MVSTKNVTNLVPRAHVPFGQHQDTELWNSQFPETKILGLPVSQRMRGLVYLESRGEVDVNTFHRHSIRTGKTRKVEIWLWKNGSYQILKAKETRALGTSLLIIPELRVLVLTKRHVGSGNEIGTWPLAGPDFLSMRKVFVSYSRSQSNFLHLTWSMTRGLPVLDPGWSALAGPAQMSRFLVLTKRSVASGDENAHFPVWPKDL